MTKITVRKTVGGDYTGFTCIGHSRFANAGSDIVCAAISVLVTNTINSMERLAGQEMKMVTNEEAGLIDVRFVSPVRERTVLFMDSLVLGLSEVQKQYGSKYLRLKFEEV